MAKFYTMNVSALNSLYVTNKTHRSTYTIQHFCFAKARPSVCPRLLARCVYTVGQGLQRRFMPPLQTDFRPFRTIFLNTLKYFLLFAALFYGSFFMLFCGLDGV